MLRATAILGLLLLGGCDVALSLARTAGQAGLDHTLGGYVHRTITEPMPFVRVASKRALANMAVKIKRTWKDEDGWHVEGEARKRVIEIWLEPLSKQTTMIRVVVTKDIISKDGATAHEVIEQAIHALNVLKAQAMLSRLGYEPGSVDGLLGAADTQGHHFVPEPQPPAARRRGDAQSAERARAGPQDQAALSPYRRASRTLGVDPPPGSALSSRPPTDPRQTPP